MILINEEELSFHLTNGKVSYVFRVMERTGILEQLYCGPAISDYKSFTILIEREIRPGNNLYMETSLMSLEHIKQEYPVFGTTDFRYPALEIQYPTGDLISHFRYTGYRIEKGKTVTGALPGTFGNEEDVETLIVCLKDDYADLELELHYAIYVNYPIITRQQKIINKDNQTVSIKRFASFSLDLPNENYDWVHLDGAWARENHLSRSSIQEGIQNVSSTRGHSSHVHTPFLAICSPEVTEDSGQVYGCSLIYSGSFLAQIESDNYNTLRIQMGINPFQFDWQLHPGQLLESPQAVLVVSQSGFNGMSQVFHDFYKEHLIRSSWKNKKRSVLLNSWEAMHFDFNQERILEVAEEASKLGIELFVLDDGWFGKRNSDTGSLGNWTENKEKLPDGLAHLAKAIKEKGMLFGLWFEPEMVSDDTDLFKEHLDWVIGNPEVVEAIYSQMAHLLSTVTIDYIKLDMNRYISESFSSHLPSKQQSEVNHRYILGVYSLYEKLNQAFPDVLIESCTGGEAHLSTMSAHVSAVPNHQVARVTSLDMRKDVAMFGVFGYELNPLALTEEKKEAVKAQIKEYHAYQELIQNGIFYRLDLTDKNHVGWLVVNKERTEALVGYYMILAQPNPIYERLKLVGLNPDKAYHILGKDKDEVRYGRDLTSIGIVLGKNYIGRENEYWSREMLGDFNGKFYYLQQIDK
ncbi:alpha-galactosidase [Streptococcus macedonicus]|uniref:alpha-galactosidase n=1 Tax=Streptococcus macedonicus TaxID=59310 RepID=UPI002244B659|nr:alpha-galactosidase [Streptococcus macedonicus]MCW8519435.1 alpha-galactosidase [Streptococcus macedonicus]MCW8521256.1 alpha-galactosidase [Streptococcus macedonicus]